MFLATDSLSLVCDHLVASGAVRNRLEALNLSASVSKLETFSATGNLLATDVFTIPVVQVELLPTSRDLLMASSVPEVESSATFPDAFRAAVSSVLMDQFKARLLAYVDDLFTDWFSQDWSNQLEWLGAVRNLLHTQ